MTLLEAMVAVSILGVIAALAVPQMLPIVQRARARGAAEELIGMVDETRRRAVSSGRCHRLVLVSSSAVQIERRDSPDCVDLTLDSWTAVRTTNIANVNLAVTRLPAGSANEAIVFRPSSRLRGDGDMATTDDAARILGAVSGGAVAFVDIASTGRMCSKVSASAPPALTAPVVCP